jgi:FixJ family two-component response regulator
MSPRNWVFVVDDDTSTRSALGRLLRLHGYHAVLFDSAVSLQDHEDFSQAFCIILDIDLNGVSGIELRGWLASSGITLPIIYLTGNDGPAARAAALGSGCLAYLTKPVSATTLAEKLLQASARR